MRNQLLFLFIILNVSFYSTVAGDLVAYYPFNGNALDATANHNDGVVTGAVLTVDRLGNSGSAYEFNGSSNYITIPNSTSLEVDGELSISVWVKPTLFPTSGAVMILGKSNYSTSTNYLLRVKPNGFLQFEYKTFANTSTNPLVLNQWNHIVVVSNLANQMTVYVNNDVIVSTSGYSPFGVVGDPLTIGRANYGSEYFNGALDEIRIYKSVLTASEINDLYNNVPTSLSTNKIKPNFIVFDNCVCLQEPTSVNLFSSLELYDLVGQKVFSTDIISSKIELPQLKNGIYILVLTSKDGKISANKLILN